MGVCHLNSEASESETAIWQDMKDKATPLSLENTEVFTSDSGTVTCSDDLFSHSHQSSSSEQNVVGSRVVDARRRELTGGFVGVLNGGESEDSGVSYQLNQSSWKSVLANRAIPKDFSEISETSSSAKSPFMDWNFPFDDRGISGTATLLALLPPKQQCDYLVSRYFTLFSPLFHILHDPTFHSDYRAFSRHPGSVNLSWVGLLFTVLALAITTLEEHDTILNDLGRASSGNNNIKALNSRYRDAAMKCLAADHFLVRHQISSLQALILLIYDINHGYGDNMSWALLGLAMNIGIALGCHINGEKLKRDCLETEIRARCWAGLTMLQTLQAISFGKSDIMRLSRHQISLPTDVNDNDIFPHTIVSCP
jgi:hypothetical protein